MAEGVAIRDGREVYVWRDFRWNNGQVWRMWDVDPGLFDQEEIEVRPMGRTSKDIRT